MSSPAAQESEMVLQDFVTELERVGQDFAWSLGHGGRIQGVHRRMHHGQRFDPVTAVCFARTGKLYMMEEGIQAARDIGLSPIAYGDIVAASNNVWARRPRPDRYGEAVRSRLLDILGVPRVNVLGVFAGLLGRSRAWGGRFAFRSRPTA